MRDGLERRHLPRHVAIIMDGNGRWAKARGLSRIHGHRRGKNSVRSVVEEAKRLGVSYLTLYTFSLENWSRPEEEVEGLMNLFREYLVKELPRLMAHEIRLRSIGRTEKLPKDVQAALKHAIRATRKNRGMTVILAVSYGGRDEITDAIQRISRKVVRGLVGPAQVTEDLVSWEMASRGIPDPDLLIRTSGERRISNFFLWQLAYTELYFTNVLWPDFGKKEFRKAIVNYQTRKRRFGRTDEQIQETNR